MKRGDELCEGAGRLAVEESNHWQSRLLRARGERPRGGRAAEQRNELPPLQLVGLHSVPASQGRRQDIELATSSQRVSVALQPISAVDPRANCGNERVFKVGQIRQIRPG